MKRAATSEIEGGGEAKRRALVDAAIDYTDKAKAQEVATAAYDKAIGDGADAAAVAAAKVACETTARSAAAALLELQAATKQCAVAPPFFRPPTTHMAYSAGKLLPQVREYVKVGGMRPDDYLTGVDAVAKVITGPDAEDTATLLLLWPIAAHVPGTRTHIGTHEQRYLNQLVEDFQTWRALRNGEDAGWAGKSYLGRVATQTW